MIIKDLVHKETKITFKIENESNVFDMEINRTDYGCSMTDIDDLSEDFFEDDLDKLDSLMSALSGLLI